MPFLHLLNRFHRNVLSLTALICVGVPVFGDDAASPKKETNVVRVLSYNIQIGRAPGGSYSDPTQAFL
ncbi:MAG: hypothetical protein IJO46_11330, partial [Thermoguttaceae bacterium]|nr:hypothetical protein [Thermoguttaceae bacterium]